MVGRPKYNSHLPTFLMNTPLRATRTLAVGLFLWQAGGVFVLEANAEEPLTLVAKPLRPVASNMELTLSGCWPAARVIDLKLVGTGAGFVCAVPDPPIDFEGKLSHAGEGIVLDYNLTIGESDLSGAILIPADGIGKPMLIARLYTYEIVVTLNWSGTR